MNTVLAIDDDKTTLGLLEAQLAAQGFKVVVESSGVRGVEIARSFSPDIILLDLCMPGMDGMAVLGSLRKDKDTKTIPVIMLTSNKARESVIEAMRHGVVDYIVKPYNPDRLVDKIKSAITYAELKKQQDEEIFIEVSRKGEMSIIHMRGRITDRAFQNDVKKVFNAFFLKQVHGKVCVFDLHNVEEMNEAAMNELMVIISLFAGSTVKIVAGRHYGEIVSMTDIEEKAELFLSFGDLELAMNR